MRTGWLKAATGLCIGILGGLLRELLLADNTFHAIVLTKWSPIRSQNWLDASLPYGTYLLILGFIVCAAAALIIAPLLHRILKSYARGIVSGLTVIWAVPFYTVIDYSAPPGLHEVFRAVLLSSAFSILSFVLYLSALIASRRDQKPIRVQRAATAQSRLPEERWIASASDAPIDEWDQDILSRSAFVESLTSAIMTSGAPVVAIHGTYGDGKTSVLHLLQKTLKDHAVVVEFSTWLPGSEDTLALELFNDIATECKRHYYVPQLRRKALAYAKSLCSTVSYLKALSELVPSTSQREDIQDLAATLSRIPVRIVVLLDEMDRMQEEELRVLLKVIRGVSAFPNLTYVCALNRSVLETILPKLDGVDQHEYFEKFFPATFELPRVDRALLYRLLSTRLTQILSAAQCFRNATEEKKFNEALKRTWDSTLLNLCTNIRKISLILNDIQFGINPIASEVNPFDFVVLETLRRFFPDIYDYIWKNGEFFVEETDTIRATFDPEGVKRDRDSKRKELWEKLNSTGHAKEIEDLLWHLFPSYGEYYKPSEWQTEKPSADLEETESSRRIFHPDCFPVFFRYQVPETVFSESELNALILDMNNKASLAECEKCFTSAFSQIPKGSLRRYSLLHRIVGALPRLGDIQLEATAIAIATNSAEYTYDISWAIAEGGAALKLVFRIAERFSKGPTIQKVLEQALLASTDDTFAYRILGWSAKPERNKIISDFSRVDVTSLQRVFVQRMQNRYGERAKKMDSLLSSGDREAFVEWVSYSNESREDEIAFWTRFIDKSQKRLAQAVSFLFPESSVWQASPAPAIDKLFPLDEFRRLLGAIPPEGTLEEYEQRAVTRLERLLKGDFSNGYNPPGHLDAPWSDAG